jgi:hypothetical protein
MNGYTTRAQARIQPHDIAAVQRVNRGAAGDALFALERQCTAHAEAEVERLLKQNHSTPKVTALRVSLLQRTIGAALVRAGERVAGLPGRGVSPEAVTVTVPFGPTS